MNGTQLSEQLNILQQLRNQEFIDNKVFCQLALMNTHLIYLRYYGYELSYLNDLEKTLQSKIKENTYDEQTVEIAREIFKRAEENFEAQLNNTKQQYTKSVRKQISRYRRSARVRKLTQQLLQLAVIVGATSVPFILNLANSPKEIATYVSGLVAISAALLKFYNFSDHIIFFKKAEERMQSEYSLFESLRGSYKDLNPGEALDHFMDQVDILRHEQNELSLLIEKTGQYKNQDQIQQIGKINTELHQAKNTQSPDLMA